MKRSAKLTLLAVSALLGACSVLPFSQPVPVAAKPKPRPRPPVAAQPTPPLIPAQPQAPVVPPATTSAASATPAPAAPATVDKGDPDARFKAALNLMKQNQPQDAETALGELARDFPQFSGPFTDLGIIYAKSKRVQPAIQAFTRAAIANPQNPLVYNWLGILLRESKDYVRAEQAYKKALAINPDYAAANLNLGILYDAYLNRPQDALPHYKAYQRMGGQDDLRVLVWIAQIEKTRPLPTTAPATQSITKPKPAATASSKPQAGLPGIAAPAEKQP